MKPIPPTVEALIKELESQYRPRCITRGQTLEDAHREAGAAELVETLRQRFDWTQKHATAKEVLSCV